MAATASRTSPRRAVVTLACVAAIATAQNCPNGGPGNVVWNKTAEAAWIARAPQHTSRSGRPLRLLEPEDGVCLHGAGQDPGAYNTYTHYMTTGAGQVGRAGRARFCCAVHLTDTSNRFATRRRPAAHTGRLSRRCCS